MEHGHKEFLRSVAPTRASKSVMVGRPLAFRVANLFENQLVIICWFRRINVFAYVTLNWEEFHATYESIEVEFHAS